MKKVDWSKPIWSRLGAQLQYMGPHGQVAGFPHMVRNKQALYDVDDFGRTVEGSKSHKTIIFVTNDPPNAGAAQAAPANGAKPMDFKPFEDAVLILAEELGKLRAEIVTLGKSFGITPPAPMAPLVPRPAPLPPVASIARPAVASKPKARFTSLADFQFSAKQEAALDRVDDDELRQSVRMVMAHPGVQNVHIGSSNFCRKKSAVPGSMVVYRTDPMTGAFEMRGFGSSCTQSIFVTVKTGRERDVLDFVALAPTFKPAGVAL